MIDLIDRDALRSAIEDTDWYHVADNGELVAGANSLEHTPLYKADDVFNAIFDAPSISAQTLQWIPVEERLPENDQWVLCRRYDGNYWVAAWDYIDWMWSDQNEWYREKDITHWMPLPEPPKGE